ncbi:MAG: hypothetical protein KJZ53_02345 [Anaerolineales bacterium]|nr:hypothetical protein [Anaerolineales bacterium]MCL4257352.1 hypothetical protein [Anaerolineales bacterium]QYK51659.1 MAG: hypothetical protein KF701_03985 [Anaerolineales bacterium]
MPHTVLIHLHNEDPVVGEIEELPNPTDTMLRVQNPRKRDGKDLHYLQNDVTTVYWPWTRISFVEILPSGGEDEIIGFVRE